MRGLKKFSAPSPSLPIRAALARRLAAVLLPGLMAMSGWPDPALAKGSRHFCDIVKIACAKKPFRPKASANTTHKRSAAAVQKRKAKQQKKAVAAVSSKSKTAKRAKPVPVIVAALPYPVTKPRRKPATSQASIARPTMTDNLQKQTALVAVPRFQLPLRDREPVPDAGDCRADLLMRNVEFSIPDHVEATGQCAVADPVQVKSVETPGGKVVLPEEPLLNCAFARKFTTWLSDVAAPVVVALAPARLQLLSTGPGYECRNRNGDSSGKISEHAFGNAIDIAGITLANRIRIEMPDVADPLAAHHRLLMALRVSACGYFATVLGPGSNAAHESHYHFDLGQHGKSGNYRICN